MLLTSIGACNSKNEENTEIVVTPAITAVSEFSLKADTRILSDLDSVFFSIDLERGVIFNADSLPKGTDIRKLIPVITFANTMSKAELNFETTNSTDTTTNYLTNPEDSINFSSPVTLEVTAQDGKSSYSYMIKVNVHEQVPDSMIWDNLSYRTLPSRLSSPMNQKSVLYNEMIYTLIEERDGSFTLGKCEDPEFGDWEKQEIFLDFAPMIESFNSFDGGFGLLSDSGDLYITSDFFSWTKRGEKWINIFGNYLGSLLGVAEIDGILKHTHFPANSDISESDMESGFPLYSNSNFGLIESQWSDMPIILMAGGEDISGETVGGMWAFDGSVWAQIDNSTLPVMKGASLVNYVTFRATANKYREREFQAWIVLGGILEDGEYNRNLYLSMDNGVTWYKGSEQLDFPEDFPSLENADSFVIKRKLSSSLSDIWTKATSPSPRRWYRPAYTLEGYDIYWECPYIYLIGGFMPEGNLSDKVMRGVLTRLVFTPLI